MKKVEAWIEDERHKQLRDMVYNEGTSISAILRTLIDGYIQHNNNGHKTVHNTKLDDGLLEL